MNRRELMKVVGTALMFPKSLLEVTKPFHKGGIVSKEVVRKCCILSSGPSAFPLPYKHNPAVILYNLLKDVCPEKELDCEYFEGLITFCEEKVEWEDIPKDSTFAAIDFLSNKANCLVVVQPKKSPQVTGFNGRI